VRLEKIEELRQPTALRLLAIWRECRREQADPLEQSLLCNANDAVLPVLGTLTVTRMEE